MAGSVITSKALRLWVWNFRFLLSNTKIFSCHLTSGIVLLQQYLTPCVADRKKLFFNLLTDIATIQISPSSQNFPLSFDTSSNKKNEFKNTNGNKEDKKK